jgi:hypothetical protein
MSFKHCFANLEYKVYNSYPYPLYSPWTSDPDFIKINSNETLSWSDSQWGDQIRYIQYVLSKHALSLEGGDFIECGVLHGKSFDIFASVLDLYDNKNRTIYGFDSFEGLDHPTIDDISSYRKTSFFFWKCTRMV